MDRNKVTKAAEYFGRGLKDVQLLSGGLIHFTYKIDYDNNSSIVLQNINTNSFRQPENLVENYHCIYNYLQTHQSEISIPEPLFTSDGKKFLTNESGFWRATKFRDDCYTKTSMDDLKTAKETANAFASFTYALRELPAKDLLPVIPGFHDLSLRYRQFEEAEKAANGERLIQTEKLRRELKKRYLIVELFNEIELSPLCRLRIMHHDCKLSNVLFDKKTHRPSCIVDLDTTMPGYFFSDVGDMVRTMACSSNEEDREYEFVHVNKKMFFSVLEGYMDGIGKDLSEAERKLLKQSGLILIYMQALRFLTDYLNNDIYYQIKYPEHNFYRAMNQFSLLCSMENLLEEIIL